MFDCICDGLVVSVVGLAILLFLWVCCYMWWVGGISGGLVVFAVV